MQYTKFVYDLYFRGGPCYRTIWEGKIAFPDKRGTQPQEGVSYEVLSVTPNPRGTVYFLKLGAPFAGKVEPASRDEVLSALSIARLQAWSEQFYPGTIIGSGGVSVLTRYLSEQFPANGAWDVSAFDVSCTGIYIDVRDDCPHIEWVVKGCNMRRKVTPLLLQHVLKDL